MENKNNLQECEIKMISETERKPSLFDFMNIYGNLNDFFIRGQEYLNWSLSDFSDNKSKHN